MPDHGRIVYRRPEPSVRLDVRIPGDLRTAAQMAAATRGETLSAAVRASLAAYIASAAADPGNSNGAPGGRRSAIRTPAGTP